MGRNKRIFLEARGENVYQLWGKVTFWAALGVGLFREKIILFRPFFMIDCIWNLDFVVCLSQFFFCFVCLVDSVSSLFYFLFVLIRVCFS